MSEVMSSTDEATQALWGMLKVRSDLRDEAWFEEFPQALMSSRFAAAEPVPFEGPDRAWYYKLALPLEVGSDAPRATTWIDTLLSGFHGAAVHGAGPEPLFVLFPGDVVCLKLYGTIWVKWPPPWSAPYEAKVLTRLAGARVGPPNEEFFPELARRCAGNGLWSVLRLPRPSVVAVKADEPGAPTNLVFNLFRDKVPAHRWAKQTELMFHCLPWHLRVRTVFADSTAIDPEAFVPLPL